MIARLKSLVKIWHDYLGFVGERQTKFNIENFYFFPRLLDPSSRQQWRRAGQVPNQPGCNLQREKHRKIPDEPHSQYCAA